MTNRAKEDVKRIAMASIARLGPMEAHGLIMNLHCEMSSVTNTAVRRAEAAVNAREYIKSYTQAK